MEVGFEKTRRNLLISLTSIWLYEFAGLSAEKSSSLFLTFDIGNPEAIPVFLYLVGIYTFIRYMMYFSSTGSAGTITKSHEHMMRKHGRAYFKKLYPQFDQYTIQLNPEKTDKSSLLEADPYLKLRKRLYMSINTLYQDAFQDKKIELLEGEEDYKKISKWSWITLWFYRH
jgi:hypothetical protein